VTPGAEARSPAYLSIAPHDAPATRAVIDR
jgi:hypothetical protein